MKESAIVKLTSEQESQILVFREKWQKFVLLTARIDRCRAMAAMEAAYSIIGEKKPKIVICDSPYSASKYASTKELHLSRRIEKKLRKPLQEQVESQLSEELIQEIYLWLRPEQLYLQGQIEGCIEDQLRFRKFISESYWSHLVALLDFGGSTLNIIYDQQRGTILQAIAEHCGWILPYAETCVICDRPTKISFSSFEDGEYIHAEGEPAIQFADGFSVYVDHGRLLS